MIALAACTAAPRSQAKVALVVDLRGVVSTSLGVAAGNPLHSLEGDTLFIDTAVRLVALGMRGGCSPLHERW